MTISYFFAIYVIILNQIYNIRVYLSSIGIQTHENLGLEIKIIFCCN